MRIGLMIGAGAWVLASLAPARAQYFSPFTGPGMLTSPEAASGAFGAGAAHSGLQQQNCASGATGRDGPRANCTTPSAPEGARR